MKKLKIFLNIILAINTLLVWVAVFGLLPIMTIPFSITIFTVLTAHYIIYRKERRIKQEDQAKELKDQATVILEAKRKK